MNPTKSLIKALTHFDKWEISLLVAASNDQLNLNAIARMELASRGCNKQGDFIGYMEAQIEYVKECDAEFTQQQAAG